MDKLMKMKQDRMSENDTKPSGRQIFEMARGVNNIVLDADEEDVEEFKEEEGEDDDDDDEQAFYYDKALYAQEEINDEEVEFDWGKSLIKCTIY